MPRRRATSLRRVRDALDFEAARARDLDPEARYRDALSRRLNREVEVRGADPRPMHARPDTLTSQEWAAAQDLLRRGREDALVLAELLNQRRTKGAELSRLEEERAALASKRRSYLQLLGVRRAPPPGTEAAPRPPPAVEEPLVVAPAVDHEALAARLSLEDVRLQLIAVDAKLADVGARELALTRDGDPGAGKPLRTGEHTLYARPRGPHHAEFFFHAAGTREGIPAPLPAGHTIEVQAESHEPRLVRRPSKS